MDFKSYFHNQYQGGESFIEEVIIPIFGEDKYEDAYEEDMLESNPELVDMAYRTGISKIIRLGKINIPFNTTHVFDITVKDHVQMERNRVAIQLLVRKIMSTYSSAFMIFHYDDTTKWDWRFTFCSKQGKNSDTTDSKRYTFLLGPNQSCRTAAENFTALYKKGGNIELDDIIKAFDVEALSKEFFEKYKQHYEKFCNFVYDHKNDAEYFGSEFATCEEKRIRDYVKKLLGRIVFLHFLQKKGWMGVPTDKPWGEGDLNFMKNLFDGASDSIKDDYLDKVLEPLFSDINTKRTDDLAGNWSDFYLLPSGRSGRGLKIPYLNGGLFERDEMDEPKSRFPKELFANLFQFFYEYNFTIDENDPNDAQVGVDPEMLGRIFENLLEDNKDKGAFYTPKEIVQYMCKESLIAYLQTDITDEGTKEFVRQFVTTYDVETLGSNEFASIIDTKLKDVKICDPAIGSGAFPMGLLKELFLCRGAIEHFENAAEIKRHIIQNNIYGVDIERGAVDIARLRFWLALIVDEVTPHALPNMDFKIMQGNSLLEQCKDINGKYVDLSDLGYKKTKKDIKRGVQLSWFEDAADLSKKQFSIKMNQYFNEDDHARKVALRKDIKDIVQQQLCDLSYNVDLSNIEDISATSEFFLWHTWFADVFEKGGFDIVIGNPPYITMTKNNTNNDILKAYIDGYLSIKRCYSKNIYTLFIEFGIINLLTAKGVISYIIPEGLFKTRSYEDCVSMMKSNGDVLFYSTFSNYVFENAVTGSLIFNYRKEKEGLCPIHFAFDESYNISIVQEEDSSIFDKISENTKELKEIAELFKGMVVKDRQSVVFDTATNNPDVFLLGKSISKWTIKTPFYTDYNSLTIIGGTKKKAKHDIAPRIVIRRTGDTLCCSLIEEPALTESTLYSCWSKDNTIDNKYLIGILNSTLIDFYNKKKNITNQQGFPQILMTDLQCLPIKTVSKSIQLSIITLVDQILSAKKANPQADTSALEAEIDRLVYDLYGLTEEEIAIIEGTNS